MALTKEIMALLVKGIDRRKKARIYDGMPAIPQQGILHTLVRGLKNSQTREKSLAVINMLVRNGIA